MKKPNVLFILSDQHQVKCTSFNEHRDALTPCLDQMKEEGVCFDTAITQSPICTPSRVSWLSGQYCHNHGYYGLNGPDPEGLPSLLSHFRLNNYHTAAIGKVHCPEHWIQDAADVFNDPNTNECINDACSYTQYLKNNGVLEQYLTEANSYPKGRDGFRDEIDAVPSQLSYENTKEGFCVNRVMNYMDGVKDDENPFFIHLSFDKPHQPYRAAQQFWDLFNEETLTLPPNADYDVSQKSPAMRRWHEEWREASHFAYYDPRTFEAARARKYHGYMASIAQVDYSIGLVMQYLEKNKLLENTIVVYSTDHGEFACEHGMMEKQPGICSDAVTRIPMIWHWKNHFNAGSKVSEIVQTIDYSKTICALTGVKDMITSDGKDISDLLYGKIHPINKIGLTESAWTKSVRKGKYRFVNYVKELFEEYPEGFYELYDLENDPWEMKNLYFAEGYESVVAELKADLLDTLITTQRVKTVQQGGTIAPQHHKKRFLNWVADDGKIAPIFVKDCINHNGMPLKFFL